MANVTTTRVYADKNLKALIIENNMCEITFYADGRISLDLVQNTAHVDLNNEQAGHLVGWLNVYMRPVNKQ